MQRNTLVRLAACVVLAVGLAAHAEDKKADPTGSWKWSMPGRNCGAAREATAKLKLEGDKVTGTVNGGRGGDAAISNGSLKGDEVSFTVERENNGTKMSQKFTGKISGDTIKGKVETKRGENEAQSRDWEATREGAAAAGAAEAKPKKE